MQKETVGLSICNIYLLTAFLFVGCNAVSPQLTPIQSHANAPPAKQNMPAPADSRGARMEAIMKAYYGAWRAPENSPQGTVLARVTIAKDGRVLSAHIIQPSGIATLDRSVQKALDDVLRVPSFETALKNQPEQFSVVINFSTQQMRDVESMDWPPKGPANTKLEASGQNR